MRNIQILLLTMLLVGTVLYFTRNRTRLIDRVFVLTFALVGVVMVSFPETSDWLAAALGVGRGVDTVIDFMLVALSYTSLQLYAKLRHQDARLVELARWIAIHNAKLPEAIEESVPNVLQIADARKLREPEWTTDPEANGPPEYQRYAKAG
jgi:small membrane protein